MTETIKEQILKIRDSGKANLFDVKAVFELAIIEYNFDELANFIFENTDAYLRFILTGE